MRAGGWWGDEVLADVFDRAAAAHPEGTAVVSRDSASGKTIRKSWAELTADVERIARGLLALGVERGVVVSVQLPNGWEFVALVLACSRLGCIVNPVMPSAGSREIIAALGACASRVIVVPRRFRGIEYEPLIANLRENLPHLAAVIVVDPAVPGGFEGLPHDCPPVPRIAGDADALTEIIFTSGTTGQPKGVMHTSNTLLSATRGFSARVGLNGDDVIFMGSPLAHQTGYLWGIYLPMLLGVTVVLLDIWSPRAAAALMVSTGATFSISAPTFLSDLLTLHESGQANLESLETFVLAGAPVPRALVERASSQTGVRIASAWGMTEVGLPTISLESDDVEKVSCSDGAIVDGMEMRIVDADGRRVPDGVDGRLQVRGAFNFVGYLNRPDLYCTDADGWFDTGDLAHVLDRRYLRIAGRTKDIIIRGGEKVPVAEIENLLYRHPRILDVAIVAKPDERLGERACAFVTLRDEGYLELRDIIDFLLAKGVTKTFLPEGLIVLSEMPRTASGKIQKFVLRERAARLPPRPLPENIQK